MCISVSTTINGYVSLIILCPFGSLQSVMFLLTLLSEKGDFYLAFMYGLELLCSLISTTIFGCVAFISF